MKAVANQDTSTFRNQRIDLHSHSIHSDGTLTPCQLIEAAHQEGLAALSITDHDSTDGLIEAEDCIRPSMQIELIAGVELSSSIKDLDVHVLGYYIDPSEPRLADLIDRCQKARVDRARKMLSKLQCMGIDVPLEHVLSEAGPGAVGRPHIAQAMVNGGHVDSYDMAFVRYIGYHGPAYVPKLKIEPREAFAAILRAGGIPVLAHPSIDKIDNLIPLLTEQGLMGLEAWHPHHTPEDVQRYLRMAENLGLVVTGGSDYHGNRRIGSSLGVPIVPYRCVDGLKRARDRLVDAPL